MSYKNIVFVKLEKRLLNDHRWWSMSEAAQLIYIKLMLLAAETYNKIPKNDNVLREALRSKLELKNFQDCLKEIKQNFPKLRENKHFQYFDEFETKTNYIPKREIPRKSPGHPKLVAEEDKEEDKDKEKDKEEDLKAGQKPPAVNKPVENPKPVSKENPLLKTELDRVFKDGFNIYSLINKTKKESTTGLDIPEDVLFKVCSRYWQDKGMIKNAWTWFVAVLRREWELFNTESYKHSGMAQSIRDILAVKQ